MKTCKIEGCDRLQVAKGRCAMHYCRIFKCKIEDESPWQLKKKSNNTLNKKCTFESCNEPQYAKGYCRKHHAILLRKGEVKYEWVERKCLVSSCNVSTTSQNGYCKFHNVRLRAGIPLDLPRQIGGGGRGERNHRWNGGVSHYPNHYELKKNRIIKLKQVDFKCELCGEKAKYVHHRDGSKTNHSIENLLPVCAKCHFSNFHNKPHASKYKRLYGFTSRELIKAGLYDEIRGIHKKLKQFRSITLQPTQCVSDGEKNAGNTRQTIQDAFKQDFPQRTHPGWGNR